MADPVEELIREIAAKHGIAVSREDPIFVLQTINQRLMQDSAKAQQNGAQNHQGCEFGFYEGPGQPARESQFLHGMTSTRTPSFSSGPGADT